MGRPCGKALSPHPGQVLVTLRSCGHFLVYRVCGRGSTSGGGFDYNPYSLWGP